MSKKIVFIDIICIMFFISGFAFGAIAGMTSANYRIPTSVLSGGGTTMGSANFKITSTLAQPSPLMGPEGPPSSQNLRLLPGFWYTTDISLVYIPFEINLPSGWSMISLPVKAHNGTVSSLFPQAVVVYSYERGSGYVRVEEEEELEVGDGYWMLLNQNRKYTLTGQRIQSYHKTVYEDGWEMIGGCTSGAQTSADSCDIGVIYRYVQGTGYQRVLESEDLEPGGGFWILFKDVLNQCKLTVEGIGSGL